MTRRPAHPSSGDIRDAIDLIDYGIVLIDSDMRVVDANRAFHKIWSLPEDLINGAPKIGDLMDAVRAGLPQGLTDLEWARARDKRLEAITNDSGEIEYVRLGDRRTVRSRVTGLPEGGHMVTIDDVSGVVRQAAEASTMHEHYELALEAADQSIWDWNPDSGEIAIGDRFWDQIWRPDLGPDIRWSDFVELIAAEYRDRFVGAVLSLMESGAAERHGEIDDLVIPTLHGEPRIFVLTIRVHMPVPDGAATVTGLIRDVSEARRLQTGIEAARERAERANQAKSTFLATITHEIRTPLNGILGTARLLSAAGLAPEHRDLAKLIEESGDALLTLINDVLDGAKIEADRMELEQRDFDLAGVVRNTVRLMAPVAGNKGLAIETDIAEGDYHLSGDAGRIRQVLLNLLGNALKFTPQGHIAVSLKPEPSTPDTVLARLTVTDTGIGIANDEKTRLFQRFGQADASIAREYGGTGLGLAISASLARAMGGKIGFESELGKGSTFWALIPLARAEGAPPKNAAAEPAGSVALPTKVLVVEDNSLNQRLLEALIERWGGAVEIVASGEAAVEAIAAQEFDLVLMDVQLPGIDGFEAAARIRALPSGGALPILAMSAHDESEIGDRASKTGMD